MSSWLNQSQLVARIREELGIPVDSRTIHLMLEQGMPCDPGFGKRPRFRWQGVHAWILEMQNPEVLNQFTTRDWFRKRQVATPLGAGENQSCPEGSRPVQPWPGSQNRA